jgi:hypothetical protein
VTTASRCTYCGGPAESPARLTWVLPARPGRRPRHIDLRLCILCSQSWTVPAPAPGATGPTDDRPAPRAAA